METHFLLELLGYLASGLIVIAMMMSSILWLRMINTVGAAAFAAYGLLIQAYPVALLNGFIGIVNLFYLTRMFRAKRFFQLLKLKPESDYLKYFLGFYRRDIANILPDFEYRPVENQVTLFILRDGAGGRVYRGTKKRRCVTGDSRFRHSRLSRLEDREIFVRGAGGIFPGTRYQGDRHRAAHQKVWRVSREGGV